MCGQTESVCEQQFLSIWKSGNVVGQFYRNLFQNRAFCHSPNSCTQPPVLPSSQLSTENGIRPAAFDLRILFSKSRYSFCRVNSRQSNRTIVAITGKPSHLPGCVEANSWSINTVPCKNSSVCKSSSRSYLTDGLWAEISL